MAYKESIADTAKFFSSKIKLSPFLNGTNEKLLFTVKLNF